MKEHNYKAIIEWTGNLGEGTSGYTNYERSHTIEVENKTVIAASSDPGFRGDPKKHNPEELFVASLSSCHMLWYLHLCSAEGVVVTDYRDEAQGTMIEEKSGKGRFTEVILYPEVTVREAGMIEKARELHHKANEMCFIANSCNFPVRHKSKVFSGSNS